MKKWLRLVLEDPYDGFFLIVVVLFSLAILAVFFARANAAWEPAGCAPVGSAGWFACAAGCYRAHPSLRREWGTHS